MKRKKHTADRSGDGLPKPRLHGDNGASRDDATDDLRGAEGDDVLRGNSGNDTLDGGTGVDTMTGGAGSDHYVVDDANDKTIRVTGGGTGKGNSGISLTLSAEIEKLTLTGTGLDGAGSVLSNLLTGNVAAGMLGGSDDNAPLYGGAGNDRLYGGAGNDHLLGDAGDDRYYVDAGNDLLKGEFQNDYLSGGAGADLVPLSSTACFADVEALSLASHSAVRNALHLLALRNSGLRHVLQLHADISTAIVSANDYRFLDGDRLGTPSPGKQGAANTLRGDNRSAVPIDYERLALLRAAAAKSGDSSNPLEELDIAVRAEAIVLLGGEAQIGRLVTSEETLVEAIAIGLPAEVLGALRKAGYPPAVLEQVIAPRRTLMRRKAEGQRLTRAESDAAWRLAYALALASHVFDGRKAALAWLSRPKAAMGNRAPIELIETSVGAAYVERMLRSLDWGDTA